MAKQTKRDRVIALLISQGAVEAKSPSRKYRKLLMESTDAVYWVGKCGALRKGITVTKSHSISHRLPKDLK